MLGSLKQGKLFYRRLWALALPMILQNLITTSLGFADTFMVGLVGKEEMSAVTVANVPLFVIQIFVFGLQSGSAILMSQYWGKKDVKSINRLFGVALYAAFALSTLFALVMVLAPGRVLALATNNRQLAAIAKPYLQIVAVSYIFNALSGMYHAMQRSTENPVFGMSVLGFSMLLNTLLNYLLIFGKFGFPALGVTGAAIATCASRIAEFLITAVYAIISKRIRLYPKLILMPGKAYWRSFIVNSIPVVCNETLWGLGTSMFTVILGHTQNSTVMLAAYTIVGNIDKLATVAVFGIAAAAAVIVGKQIGEGNREKVYGTGIALNLVSTGLGLLTALALLLALPTLLIPHIFPLFKLTGADIQIASIMALFTILTFTFRCFDIANVVGVLRGGGDVRWAMLIDVLPLWCVAIPLTAIAALWLKAPVPWICLAYQSETLVKMPLGIWRLRSRKWIKDLTMQATK